MRLSAAVSLLLVSLALVGCQSKSKSKSGDPGTGSGSSEALAGSGSAGSGSGASAAAAPDLDSKEILARTKVAPEAYVQHVLIAWNDLEPIYASQGGALDPRAKTRDAAAAAKLAQQCSSELKTTPAAIVELMQKYSEDPNASTGDPILVKAGGPSAEGFQKLALRLNENEAGIVKTPFGYHVMMRVPKPTPDPLESTDILAREAETPPIHVQHILIGWDKRKRNTDPRAIARTKEAADTLAKEVLAKVRAGGDMAKLMKQYSEDPGSKDTAQVYEVDPRMVEPFKNLAMRLKIGEAGLVPTAFGWHVIKRVTAPPPPPPPPPDKLDSMDILKRKPETQAAKVKHILLGWKDAHADDPRGEKRTRAELEALVPEIVKKARGGQKFEELMVTHSEDAPQAVKAGNAYDVTPDASLVDGFKNLSLRLKVGEVGVVKTEFGIHIIKRVE